MTASAGRARLATDGPATDSPGTGSPGTSSPGTSSPGTDSPARWPAEGWAQSCSTAIRLGLRRGRLEVTSFFRQRDTVVFTFGLPVLLLLVFGQMYRGSIGHTGVPFRQYFAAGIIASGIMSTSFVNLGTSVTADRDDGTLRRLAGTPMPAASYFIGKAISALVITLAEVALLLGAGTAWLGLALPANPQRWLTLGWVLLLAVATCSLLGVAVAGLARSARSSSSVVMLPYLVLSFISGVYVVFSKLPADLQRIAALFPLKWMCQGLRSVFLRSSFLAVEQGHSWQLGRVALVLGCWLAASLVLCVTTFRWQRRA